MQQWRVIKTRQELSLRRWKNKRITGKRYKSKNKSYNWKSIKSKWIKWISLLMNYWNKPKVHTNKLLWINKNSNKLCKFFFNNLDKEQGKSRCNQTRIPRDSKNSLLRNKLKRKLMIWWRKLNKKCQRRN